MTVDGFIYDNANTDYLPGVSVQVVNSAGNTTGEGATTDNNGYFSITSATLNQGGKLLLSSVGYSSLLVAPTIFTAGGMIGLDENPTDLQAAIVTAQKPKDYTWYVIAGGALVAATAPPEKRGQKVGGIDVDWKFLAVAGGIGVAGYFLIVKPILQSLGILKTTSPTDQATAAAQKSSLDQAKQQAANSGTPGAGQNFPDSQYQNWANTIERLGPDSDWLGITNIVTQCNSLVDWLSLVNAWGIRQEGGTMCAYFNVYCTSYDLPSYLRAVLPASSINNINLYFSAQGINYQL